MSGTSAQFVPTSSPRTVTIPGYTPPPISNRPRVYRKIVRYQALSQNEQRRRSQIAAEAAQRAAELLKKEQDSLRKQKKPLLDPSSAATAFNQYYFKHLALLSS